MNVDPYQSPQSEQKEENSAKFPFLRIVMHAVSLWILLLAFSILFRDDDESVREAAYDFIERFQRIDGMLPYLLILGFAIYKEFKEYKTPDSVFVDKLDSPKTNDTVKALIVLKRRKVDFSSFLPKLLPKLVNKSLMKRSSTYSMIKKYYPEVGNELSKLKSSKFIGDLGHCKQIVAPVFERYGVAHDAPPLSDQESEALPGRDKDLTELRASFSHSSEVRVPEKPTGKSSQFIIQVCCMLVDLFILVLWVSGVVLAFFVSGWFLKFVCVVGCFGLGYVIQSLSISYFIRRFFLQKISRGNEHIKKCLITTEKLGTQDKFHLLADDMGYLFATSDGYKLVTLGGINHLLETDSVRFIRASEVKSACAIDCQNRDGSSMFDMVLNPMHNKWDMDTQAQGELKYEWFIDYMHVANLNE